MPGTHRSEKKYLTRGSARPPLHFVRCYKNGTNEFCAVGSDASTTEIILGLHYRPSKKCDKQSQRETNVSASRLVIQHAHGGNNGFNRLTEAKGQRRPSTHTALIPDPV